MAEPATGTAPSLGRDALSGRLERALTSLEDDRAPAACWRRAWLLTAVGRYGEALAACDDAMRGDGLLQASALMVEAMLYRQVSLHARSEEADDRALAILRAHRGGSTAVRAGIRVGQVADAVGLQMEEAVLTRRLKVAAAAVTQAGSWRQQVRLTWVRGEVAMVQGRWAAAARSFGAGAKIAADQGARRHEAKSLIFLAAARAGAGQPSDSRRLATRGLHLAARCGAAPLIWPAELILAEVDPDGAEAHLQRARSVAGGLLRSLPDPLRREALQGEPAVWLLADHPVHAVSSATPSALGTDA